jgi:hypothetical protein
LKKTIIKYLLLVGFFIFLIACSTRRNSFLSRNSHALSTKYNILYNGGLALDAGLIELKGTYKDNYWEILPIERMQTSEEAMMPGEARNANFERAEEKAIKAIQKHSMNIGASEKNPQMDEAHLMLGKARYYDQRFVPALEAFNYILYKYPTSDKIYEAKVWREKTNIRMENDALAVKNLTKLLDEIEFKDQIYADANAILAQAFLNLAEKDSAIAKLRVATDFTKLDEEKARYRFILGQLYESMGEKDSAFVAFQDVIDMKRKSPRMYVIQAHARQSAQFNFKTGDTLAFVENYTKLLEDRDNRPFLDVLNHQLGLFYDKQKNYSQATKYYNKSLRSNSQDAYLVGSNYRNLADINFNTAKYATAGKYYDSTLVQINPRSREHKAITKKRVNLNDVIKYEAIAQANDSILNVVAMSESQRTTYYQEFIEKLKAEDELKRKQEDKAREQLAAAAAAGDMADSRAQRNSPDAAAAKKPARAQGQGSGTFYFYNPATVAYGRLEFTKNWGNRTLENNWRIITAPGQAAVVDNQPKGGADASDVASNGDVAIDERYTVDYYVKSLPTNPTVLDSLAKQRNFAYYQLGVIYKEKFKEYQRAADKLETLLVKGAEERLILPSMYHLYKIYQIIDEPQATAMKQQIISQYPDSRYAEILSSSGSGSTAGLTPETAYNQLFKRFEAGDYKILLIDTEAAIDQYTGEEIVAKFELLKARTIGKLKGLEEYKKALNFVALNYPNLPEGKEAELLLGTTIPALANLQFSSSATTNWKILYRAKGPEDKATKALQAKVDKFIKERQLPNVKTSFDLYTEDDNFIVIHGLKSEEYAKGIASILKEFKEYKVADTPIIIAGQNYEIVQMKKNLDAYLTNPQFVEASVTDQLPFTPPVREVVQPAPQAKPQQPKAQTDKTKTASPIQPASQKTTTKAGKTGSPVNTPSKPGQQPNNSGMPPSMPSNRK